MKQESLVRQNLNASLGIGSLEEFVKRSNERVLHEFRNKVLLIDTSYSMQTYVDESTSRRKIEVLRDIVNDVNRDRSVPMVAFGLRETDVRQVNDVPLDDSGSTPLAEAIAFAKLKGYDHCVVISDGEPDNKEHAMREARKFGGRIDVVYVGPKGSRGELFLRDLSNIAGGRTSTEDLVKPKELKSRIRGFLGA